MLYVKTPHSEVLGLRMGRDGQTERSISIGPVQPKNVVTSALNTGAMLYQLSYETTHWERGQSIAFIYCREG